MRVVCCLCLWGTLGPVCASPAAGMFAPEASSPASPPAFTVSARWVLGGVGGWDYMAFDPTRARLFVSHGDRVEVVDAAAGKVISAIEGLQGVHGIALAEPLKRGYISNGRSNSVTVFDLDTLKVLQQIPIAGENPDAILYEPAYGHVLTFNGRSKNVTILDADSMAVVKTLAVPDKPEFAVTDGKGQVFVNIESKQGVLVKIDSMTGQIERIWPLTDCSNPSGLAFDVAGHRLFSVCEEGVMVVTNSDSGRRVATIPIGRRADAAAYDAIRNLVFSSNGEGSLTIVRQDSNDVYSVVQRLETQDGARTLALDPKTGRVYVVTADFEPMPKVAAEQPHPRPQPVPATFTVLVIETRRTAGAGN